MIETYLRPTYNRVLVNPIAKLLHRTSVTSNMLTLSAALCGVVAMPLIILDNKLWAIVALLLSGYLDTLDGTLARISFSQSNLGSIYDIMSDRIVELAILLGLFLIDPQSRGLASFAVLGSFYLCVTAFLCVGIFKRHDGYKSFFYSTGLIERAEVFVFFILMILFPSLYNVLAWLLTILVIITAFMHIYHYVKKVTYN